MTKQYTPEELWKLYQKLPQELQETIFAVETANYIGNICERYDIKEETMSEIARQVGNVLLGILPPTDFQNILEEEIKLEKEVAKKVAQEIYQFIFYSVKPALEKLYKIEITPSDKPPVTPPSGEKPPAPPGPDIYRESIE